MKLAAGTLWAAIVLRIERNQAALLTEIFPPTHPHAPRRTRTHTHARTHARTHDGTRDGWLRSGEVDNFHPALAKFKCLLTRAFATLYTSKLGRKLTMTMRLVRRQKELFPPAAG